MDERSPSLTTQGQQTATQTASWSDFSAKHRGMSYPRRTSNLSAMIKMIRKLQQQGQISVARMCVPVNFFQPNQYQGQIVHIIVRW